MLRGLLLFGVLPCLDHPSLLQDPAVWAHVSDRGEADGARDQGRQRGQGGAGAAQPRPAQRGLLRGWLPFQLHGETGSREGGSVF